MKPQSQVPPWGVVDVAVAPTGVPGELLVWGRVEGQAPPALVVSWLAHSETASPRKGAIDVTVEAEHAGTFRGVLAGLPPGEDLNIVLSDGFQTRDERQLQAPPIGRLDTHIEVRTPPAADAAVPSRIAFGADLGGQGFCRPAEGGWPIVQTLLDRDPDLFVALGDMVYADGRCDPVDPVGRALAPAPEGPASTREGFAALWQHDRRDAGIQRLQRSTPLLVTLDDHEVTNDFGPSRSPGPEGRPLLGLGMAAFRDHNPVSLEGPLYRSVRWGKNLEVFLLDTRSYRHGNELADGPGKSMLGQEQRAWLEAAVQASDARWKVIASSVPLTVPTGTAAEALGRDGWASGDLPTGFEAELLGLLGAWRAAGVDHLVVITSDVHFAGAQRLTPFQEDPSFTLTEVISGPLHAGLYPTLDRDPTLRPEVLFFHGPASPDQRDTWDEMKTWWNVGFLDVDADGRLVATIVDATGAERGRVDLGL